MPTFIKYPISKPFHKKMKSDIFVILDKVEKTDFGYNYYPVKNTQQFYMKFHRIKLNIVNYKHSINIEKATKEEIVLLLKDYATKNKVKFPRKYKKRMTGTIDYRKKHKSVYVFYDPTV